MPTAKHGVTIARLNPPCQLQKKLKHRVHDTLRGGQTARCSRVCSGRSSGLRTAKNKGRTVISRQAALTKRVPQDRRSFSRWCRPGCGDRAFMHLHDCGWRDARWRRRRDGSRGGRRKNTENGIHARFAIGCVGQRYHHKGVRSGGIKQ